ncbi:STAS domain-containing protein [Xanthobacter versatilis]|uniref:STAS domain-containing protein n=1 Tax=Xanthobacter autotrophicus (strain ATCC BAA-1158 / Py2) TaxID=78245 RepID=UPI000307C178
MKIESQPLRPGVVLVSLDGRLDISGAAQVEPQFKAACDAANVVLVDLSRTPFMASIGIRLLLTGAKGLRRKGGSLHLCACDPQVEKVLVATGVHQLVAIHATRDEALAAAGSSSGT